MSSDGVDTCQSSWQLNFVLGVFGVGTEKTIARCRMTGTFEFCDQNDRTILPRSKKAVGLLAYLLYLRGQPVSRDMVADLFWSNSASDLARSSLRQTLSEIRRCAPPALNELFQFERNSLRIEPSSIAFEDDSVTSTQSRGELLRGVDPVATVFDEWLEEERRFLQNEQVRELEEILATASAPRQRVEAAEKLLTIEPENEMAAQNCIAAYAELGKPFKATDIFNKVSKALNEIGVAVSEKTLQSHQNAQNRVHSEVVLPTVAGPPKVVYVVFSKIGKVTADHVDYLNSALLARLGDVREVSVSFSDKMRLADISYPHRDSSYILCGSIGVEGEYLNCNVNIFSAVDGTQLSSIRTRESFLEPIAAIEVVIDRIVSKLVPKLESIEQKSLPEDQSNWSAYQNYLFAKASMNQATDVEYAQNVEPHFSKAIEMDPDLVLAYPPLVSILNSRHRSTRPGHSGKTDFDLALELAKKALVLDATFPNSHVALAWCLIRRKEFGLAEQSAIEAIRFGPYEASRLNSLGSIFVLLGDHAKGEEFYQKAREIQFNDLNFQNTDVGELLFFKREYKEALGFLTIGESRNPTYALTLKAAAHAQLGQLTEAKRSASEALEQMKMRWEADEDFSVEAATKWFLKDFPLRRQIDYDNLIEGLFKAGFSL